MNEVLTGIKLIKLYAWEKPFTRVISEHRRREVDSLFRAAWAYTVQTTLRWAQAWVVVERVSATGTALHAWLLCRRRGAGHVDVLSREPPPPHTHTNTHFPRTTARMFPMIPLSLERGG
jgi:hypothetical protein